MPATCCSAICWPPLPRLDPALDQQPICWSSIRPILTTALPASPPPRSGAGPAADLLVFDPADPDDRAALQRTHGRLAHSLTGEHRLRLTTGAEPGPHELCTRRLPADWSRHGVLHLELAAARGGRAGRGASTAGELPLLLSLRWRNRTGWSGPRWYWPHLYLDPLRRQLELDLAGAEPFLDRRRVRQLCLALQVTASAGPAELELGRISLRRSWSLEQTPPPDGAPLALFFLDDGHKLGRFDPPPASARPLQSAEALRLEGARNEVLAFQVLLRRGRAGPPQVQLSFSPLQGPQDQRLPLRAFLQEMVPVREGSSAMFGPGLRAPGWIPDPLHPLPGQGEPEGSSRLELQQGNNLLLFDLQVPEAALPGEYTGELVVSAPGQSVSARLRLTVHPIGLPRRRSLVMVYFLSQLIREATGAARGRAFERDAMRLAQAHGAYLVTTPSLGRLEEYRTALNGSLFVDGPSPGEPLPYWPVDLMAEEREPMQQAAVQAMRWFQANAPRTRPFVYLADEPDSLEAYQSIRRRAAWIKAAPPPGNQLPIMVTEGVKPRQPEWPSLEGAVDYWVSPLNFPEPARSRRLTHRGERFFTYNGAEPMAGSQLLDADGVALRSWGWIAHRLEIDLWLLWQGAYYRDIYNGGGRRFSTADPRSYDRRLAGRAAEWGNGDGILFHVSPVGAPLASLRLKAIRRGVQDLLYLQLAGRCGQAQAARQLQDQLVPWAAADCSTCATPWPRDPARWEAARRRLLRLLAGCQPTDR